MRESPIKARQRNSLLSSALQARRFLAADLGRSQSHNAEHGFQRRGLQWVGFSRPAFATSLSLAVTHIFLFPHSGLHLSE